MRWTGTSGSARPGSSDAQNNALVEGPAEALAPEGPPSISVAWKWRHRLIRETISTWGFY